MSAEITYNAGKSYRIGVTRFVQGVTKTIDDPKVIERCRTTLGFSILDLKVQVKRKPRRHAAATPPIVEDAPVKKVREVERPNGKKYSKKSSSSRRSE